MANTYQTVDAYIATFPATMQELLQTIRGAIHQAVPGVEETIINQIPVFQDRGLIFALRANHHQISLSAPPPTLDIFKKELAPYIRTDHTIRFPLDEPMPLELIAKIARYRSEENRRGTRRKY